MRNSILLTMAILMAGANVPALADQDDYGDREYYYRSGNTPEVEVWTNKGSGARYYFGEDVAVYFRAENDCYVVVYDINPSGEVSILFPSSYQGSSYVESGRVYRVPDYGDDFRLEIAGNSGDEHVFAVASYEYINPPDYMQYVGYDYGDDSYYDDDYFAIHVRGDLDSFVHRLNARICSGPYVVAHARFFVDTNYRHHQHYRYSNYDPYYVSSIWIGCDYPGSEIWIDGVFIGIAPVLVPRVVVGYHWVWVYYGGYPCYQRYFYVPSYQRYYIDVRIDQRYYDHKFRRRNFRGWVFEEKKYRNEDGFKERAREIRQKSVRTRSLPQSIVRDYADKGVISKDAPIVKKARTGEIDRNPRPIDNNRDIKSQNPRSPDREGKGTRTRTTEPREDKRERRDGGETINRRDTDNRSGDDVRVIVPERKPEAEPKISKPKPAEERRDTERKSSESSWQKRERTPREAKSEPQVKEQRNSRQEQSREQKMEQRREEKKSSGEVKKQEKPREDSGRKESSARADKKENRSTGKASKADRSKGKSR